MGHKTCTRCQESLPIESFNKAKNGRRARCKTCQQLDYRDYVSKNREKVNARRREYNSLRRWNMSASQVEAILAAADYSCEACGCPRSEAKALVLDHDHSCCPGEHTCGKCIRGVLCWHCNIALGYLKDDPKRIKGLLTYAEVSHV